MTGQHYVKDSEVERGLPDFPHGLVAVIARYDGVALPLEQGTHKLDYLPFIVYDKNAAIHGAPLPHNARGEFIPENIAD